MKIHFLGGADEIGASCAVVETARHRILIDAGVRMGSAQKDRLPDLVRATELGGLDEILVTHAHMDHTGALPLVHGAFPRARLWMTEPTLGLLQILLRDAIKIMELKSDQEGEIPLYPLPAVEALLARSNVVRWMQPVMLCDGDVRATFFQAGHVLGAAAIGLETPEGNVLFTGDLSVTDQLTVSGMARPRFSPDVVICESTYGARLHASRRAEEQRLAQTVVDVLHDGGKVLIPAFALGRAQEVLLILRRALAKPDAPAATVYADGMVRSVCGVYSQHADYLSPPLRDRARAGRGLFYTADGRIRPVESHQQREEILAGGPCVVVASSGMLSGGPSSRYAAGLASSAEALIAITGYQDEEAPGRQLQDMASGASKELTLDGRRLPIRCRVETYGLSAHADAQELTALVRSLEPRAVVLVHGDAGARQGLARAMYDGGCKQVHLPAIGDGVDFAASPPRRPRAVAGTGQGRSLDERGLAELHRHLWDTERRGRTYTVADLAERWYGTGSVPVDLSPVEVLLRSDQRFFTPDGKRPFLYRCVDPEQPAPTPADSLRDEAGRLEQNAALALADALLGPDSGLYRRGADRESWSLRLNFRFPDVAREQHAQAIAEIAEQSGWQVEVHPEAHLASLEQLALRLLRPEVQPTRSPSIRTDERVVKIAVASLPTSDFHRDVAERFRAETGYTLQLQVSGPKTAPAKQAYDDSGRMEINLALAEVELAFADQEHRPYKKSKKRDAEGELIELAFISPEVGARYASVTDELEAQTRWRIRVAPKVDQQAVLRVVRELVPDSWQMTKGPGLDVAGRRVMLRLGQTPPEDERARVAGKLVQLTGFDLA